MRVIACLVLICSQKLTNIIIIVVNQQANRDAPHYRSKYCAVEKKLTLSMAAMNVELRQETVCHMLELIDEMRSLLK